VVTPIKQGSKVPHWRAGPPIKADKIDKFLKRVVVFISQILTPAQVQGSGSYTIDTKWMQNQHIPSQLEVDTLPRGVHWIVTRHITVHQYWDERPQMGRLLGRGLSHRVWRQLAKEVIRQEGLGQRAQPQQRS
jgi:hypothetical protein